MQILDDVLAPHHTHFQCKVKFWMNMERLCFHMMDIIASSNHVELHPHCLQPPPVAIPVPLRFKYLSSQLKLCHLHILLHGRGFP